MGRLRTLSTLALRFSMAAGVGLLLAELLVRWLSPQPLLTIDPGLYAADPPGRYRLRPGYHGVISNGVEFTHRVTIDERGFRITGGDGSEASPAAALVAFLGDSFTFGQGVEDDETFAARLPHHVDSPLRTLNAGLPGIGVPRTVERYERHVRSLGPDVAVLAVFLGNDLSDARPDGEPIRLADGLIAPAATPRGLRSRIYGSSHLARLLGTAGAAPPIARLRSLLGWGEPFAVRNLRREMSNYAVDPPEVFEEALVATEAAIARWVESSRADRVTVAAVLLPARIQLVDSSWQRALEVLRLDPEAYDRHRPRQHFSRLLHRNAVPTLDLTSALQEAIADGERLYYRHDRHFTARGHELAAIEIGRFLDPLIG